MLFAAANLVPLPLAQCILLGEIENAFVSACGFGSGWTCGGPYSCELWKLGAWPGDDGDVDRGFCWTWFDQLYFAVMTYVTIVSGGAALLLVLKVLH